MSDHGAPKIRLEHVTKTYQTERGEPLPVLRDVTADCADGEFVSIIGPSGCGKTTLLYLVSGLMPVTSGAILMDGRQIEGPGRDRGMAFQQDVILMWRTVQQNAEYGLELRGVPKRERRETALKYLQMVGLEAFADFYPKELSGGMKKRAQIAAVFANNPEVLLMDEPFGSLDYPTKIGLQAQLQKIWLQEKKLILFVTHDLEEALFLSNRILALVDGEVARIYDVPFVHPRTDELRISTEFQNAKGELWEFLEPRKKIERT